MQRALHEVGLPADALVLQPIDTEHAAQDAGFGGSSSMLVDAGDPFAEPDSPPGLSCRVFRTTAGLAGAPTLEQLVLALEKRA